RSRSQAERSARWGEYRGSSPIPLKSATTKLRPKLPPPLVLALRFAIQPLHFPDRFDVTARLQLVMCNAHQLIGFAMAPFLRRRMLTDEVVSFFASLDAAFEVLLLQERVVFALREVEPGHHVSRGGSSSKSG